MKYTPPRAVQNLRNGMSLYKSRKTLWQMMREVMAGSYRMSGLTVVVVIASLAYVVFPLDLVPDFIPVLGWIDDGVVVYLLIGRLTKETQRYIRHKAMGRKGN